MLLSIIIPQYSETEEILNQLLTSIDTQINVDWKKIEVLIVNDSNVENCPSQVFLDSFKNIKPKLFILDENKGPGLCRQYGIDKAQNDYVMFCDTDDILYSSLTLFSIMRELKNKYDYITSHFVEEIHNDNNEFDFIIHENKNTTWLHGKVFKRRFLIENNLRFSSDLFYHEDSYFLNITTPIITNFKHLDFISYIWRYNKESITRKNSHNYASFSLSEFIKAITLASQKIFEDFNIDVQHNIIQLFTYIYIIIQKNNISEGNRINIINSLHNTYLIFKDLIDLTTEEYFSEKLCTERKNHSEYFIEKQTFHDFLNMVKNHNFI